MCYDRICTKTLTTRAPPEQPLYRYVTRLRAVPSSEIIFPLIFVVKLFFVVQNFGRVKFAGGEGKFHPPYNFARPKFCTTKNNFTTKSRGTARSLFQLLIPKKPRCKVNLKLRQALRAGGIMIETRKYSSCRQTLEHIRFNFFLFEKMCNPNSVGNV